MYKNLLTLALLLGAALASIVACGDASTDEIEWDYHDHNIPDAGDDTDDPGDVIQPQQHFCGMPVDSVPNAQLVCEPCSDDIECSDDSSFLCDLQMDGGTCRPVEEMVTDPCEGYEFYNNSFNCGFYFPQFGDEGPSPNDMHQLDCEVVQEGNSFCGLWCNDIYNGLDVTDPQIVRFEPENGLFESQSDSGTSRHQCQTFN